MVSRNADEFDDTMIGKGRDIQKKRKTLTAAEVRAMFATGHEMFSGFVVRSSLYHFDDGHSP